MIFVSTVSKNIETKVLNSVIFEDRNKQRICVVECIKCGCTAYESRFLNAENEIELSFLCFKQNLGNSSYNRKIFTLQKRIIRIMMSAHHRNPCRKLFKMLEILTDARQYIYSVMGFFLNWKPG